MASQTQVFVVAVLSALLGAAYVPRIGAQAILELSAAYNLAGGFFVYNVQEGSCLGVDGNWHLTQGSYGFALSNTPYYLFNLTYNRNIGGTPPSFNSSQWFEIMMSSATDLQWNVYNWRNPVDMYSVGSRAVPNALFSFQLLDPFNKFYAIVSKLNNLCVTAVGRGGWQILPCQVTNTSQFFQFIDPNGYPAQLTQTMVAVNLSTAYSLPNYFMYYNVHDSSALGKQISPQSSNWFFQESTNLTAAALDPDFYFNLSYNRGSGGVPTFTSRSVFEINVPATEVASYLQWNIYDWFQEVAMYNVGASSVLNAVFSFALVDPLNNLYLILSPLYSDAYCVTSIGHNVMWLTPCSISNTTQLFQFINPNNQVPALPPPTTATTTTTSTTTTSTSPPTTTTSPL